MHEKQPAFYLVRRSTLRTVAPASAAILCLLFAVSPLASRVPPFAAYEGFERSLGPLETDELEWQPARARSGSGGMPSATGNWHVVLGSTGAAGLTIPLGDWGGVGPVLAEGGFSTFVDVYLDTELASDQESWFTLSSALSTAGGEEGNPPSPSVVHHASVTIATDPSTPGRFLASAGLECDDSPPDAQRELQVIDRGSGWYTVRHTFREHEGDLAVEVALLDPGHEEIARWELGAAERASEEPRASRIPIDGLVRSHAILCHSDLAHLAIDNMAAVRLIPDQEASPHRQKQAVVTWVRDVGLTGEDILDEGFRMAHDDLDKVLAVELWRSSEGLSERGSEVFDHESRALRRLIRQQSLERAPPGLEAILEAAAYRLVESDPRLAAIFVDEADEALRRTCTGGSRQGTCGKSERHLAKARSALAAAESALSAGDFAGVARNCALSLKAIEKAQSKTRDFDAVQIQAALNEALVVAAEAGCWENDADADGDCRKAWTKISGARALIEQGDRDFAVGATSEAAERYRKAHQHISKALEKLRYEG